MGPWTRVCFLHMNEPTLHLIDGHSLTFKAYYAIRGLTTPEGLPTGAVYGFVRMLLRFLDDHQPQWVAVVFDTGKPSFRREIYDQYKANREAPPPDFEQQMGWIHRLLAAMGIPVYEREGFEADDLIATMAEHMKTVGGGAVIMTADKDLYQLVDDRVHLIKPNTDSTRLIDAGRVEQAIGVRPEQVVDWLALVGDSSDNIPGVPGIGQKTAARLLQEFGDVESIVHKLDQLPRPRLAQAIQTNMETLRMAQRLARVRRDVAFEWCLEDCRVPVEPVNRAVIELLKTLGFESILRERGIQAEGGGEPSTETEARDAVDYHVLTDLSALQQWVAEAAEAQWLALDTETTSTNPMEAGLVGISLSTGHGSAVYLPLGHQVAFAARSQLTIEAVRDAMSPLLVGGPRLTAHNAKYDWKVLRRHGFELQAPGFDTMLASYLLDPDRSSGHGLKGLAGEVLGIRMRPIQDLIGRGRHQITIDRADMEEVGHYACRDADVTLRLTGIFRERLGRVSALDHLMEHIELPLQPVLIAMEEGGFKLDVEVLREQGQKIERRIQQIAQAAWEAAGRRFNLNSPRQVAEVLYVDLGLKPGRKGKTGYSTAEAELERLAGDHPVARLILDYRGMEKLKSTYIDALPKMVNTGTGRIHTSFNQTTAATGRLTSTDPNLQNIPIRTEPGRAIRRAFVADDARHQLMKADYSQIELRILAHISQDQTLREAYRQGRDIHRQTAAEVFGVALEKVTAQMRSQAKIINFGIIYGMSAHGLAQQLGCGRAEAGKFIERYFNTYPGVRRWIERLLQQARQDGWVQTLMGRRRWVRDLRAENRMLRSAAERIAVNTPIQGTCADMIKLAMIWVDRGLSEAAPGARMVCQVHDELVFTVPKEHLAPAGDFVSRSMSGAIELDVPVEVDITHGPNWAEC